LVLRREDWKWSSYAATVGLAPLPAFLSIDWVQTLFPADSLSASQSILRKCLDEPHRVLAYLDSIDPASAAAARYYITEGRKVLAQPNSYRTLTRPPLEQLFKTGQSRSERIAAIQLAHETHGYKLAEIAKCLSLHPTTVSKIYCRHRYHVDGVNSSLGEDFNRSSAEFGARRRIQSIAG
jgi:hypothetical protein